MKKLMMALLAMMAGLLGPFCSVRQRAEAVSSVKPGSREAEI